MKKFLPVLAIMLSLTVVSACKKPDGKDKGPNDDVIKNYIMNHPEVLVESLTKYEQQSRDQDDSKINEEIKNHAKDIFNNPHSPIGGNPDGKKIMVEFFDYNCHYCKGILPDLKKILAEDKDVKVIFKELPILGPTSSTTAAAALTVNQMAPEKYFAFHTALMSHQGPADDDTITQAAIKAGIKPEELVEKMKNPELQKMLADNVTLARTLNISGTPTFIINGKIVRGAIRYENMKQALNEKAK